jgi:hypothetical protein
MLEFDITADDFRAHLRRINRGFTQRVDQFLRIGMGAVILSSGIGGWRDGDYWFAAFCMLCGTYLLISRRLLYWWLLRYLVRNASCAAMTIEADDRGLLLRNPEYKSRNRLWWSRLSRIDTSEAGLDFYFDGESYPTLTIPDRAFADAQQRESLLQLAEGNLPEPADVKRV